MESKCCGTRIHRRPIDEAQPVSRRVSEKDVFGHRQLVEENGFLVDRRNPISDRRLGALKPDRQPIDHDLAGVRVVDAGENLDERRLPAPFSPIRAVTVPG